MYKEALRRISELPGVERASIGTIVPWRDAGAFGPGFGFAAFACLRLLTDSSRFQNGTAGAALAEAADAAGATWFGYRTAWINRSRALPEQAHARPVIVSEGMDGVLALTRM